MNLPCKKCNLSRFCHPLDHSPSPPLGRLFVPSPSRPPALTGRPLGFQLGFPIHRPAFAAMRVRHGAVSIWLVIKRAAGGNDVSRRRRRSMCWSRQLRVTSISTTTGNRNRAGQRGREQRLPRPSILACERRRGHEDGDILRGGRVARRWRLMARGLRVAAFGRLKKCGWCPFAGTRGREVRFIMDAFELQT